MIHASPSFPCIHSFHVSSSYASPSTQLIRLTNPALMTSQSILISCSTKPMVPQEVTLLDGVDAGVHRHGRRFPKTSSHPPCHHYAFLSFYHYLLMTSLSPLFLMIHSFPTTHWALLSLTNTSHTPYRLCSLLSFLHSTLLKELFLSMAE